MLNWTVLTALLVVLFMDWLSIRIFLQGPTLRDYDQVPPNGRVGSRERASPAHQEAVRRLEQATAEIHAAPRKQRWFDTDYQLREVDAGGVPGEWVLAPDSDPHRRLLYLHGGSFISGCPRGHRVITTKLAQVTGASILALDYRLMPEHSRRDINADCQTGYRWILDHGPTGPAPVRELFVAGDSAGGGLALMLTAWARDAGLRPAHGVIALSPGVDLTLSSPTLKSNLKTDLVLGPGLKGFLRIPRPIQLLMIWGLNRMAPPNPLVSPVFGDLSGLPPILVQVSETEMMLGDAQRYVNKARAAGSHAELETWPDMLHVWHLFEPILPEAGEAFERIGQFVEGCISRPNNV